VKIWVGGHSQADIARELAVSRRAIQRCSRWANRLRAVRVPTLYLAPYRLLTL
jgi:hypothetical protein